jgi:transposase
LARVNVEIHKRSNQAEKFVVLPKHGVVGRTFAWLGRYRRPAGESENLNRKALEHFQAKWTPVRVKKMRRNKNLQPHSDSIGTEKALEHA